VAVSRGELFIAEAAGEFRCHVLHAGGLRIVRQKGASVLHSRVEVLDRRHCQRKKVERVVGASGFDVLGMGEVEREAFPCSHTSEPLALVARDDTSFRVFQLVGEEQLNTDVVRNFGAFAGSGNGLPPLNG